MLVRVSLMQCQHTQGQNADRFYKNLAEELDRITDWLGLQAQPWSTLLALNKDKTNVKAGAKEALLRAQGLDTQMTYEQERLLQSLFAPYNRELERLVNQSFGWLTDFRVA